MKRILLAIMMAFILLGPVACKWEPMGPVIKRNPDACTDYVFGCD